MKTAEQYLLNALEEHHGVPMPTEYWQARPVPAAVAAAALQQALADADKYRYHLIRALRRTQA